MVLTPKNLNARSRIASNSQNVPPRLTGSRSLVNRLRGSLEAARRHNRLNGRPSSSAFAPNVPVTLTKSTTTRPERVVNSKPLNFPIRTIPTPILDVEMGDATPSASRSRKTQVDMPRELARPEFIDIDFERLIAIDESLADTNLSFLQQHLDVMGQDFLQSLGSTSITGVAGKHIPKEIDLTVNDLTSIAPSHVLAVRSMGKPRAGQPEKVCLYPVHSVVFVAQCAKMPEFPPMLPLPDFQAGQQTIRVPVFPIGVPHPESFPALLKFLYSKREGNLIKEMIPLAPPPMLLDDPAQLVPYATKLAHTFTDVKLVECARGVHGLWQNMCGFNIDNRLLWDTVDLIWKILLTALSISTGKPHLMIPPPSSPPTEAGPSSSSSSS